MNRFDSLRPITRRALRINYRSPNFCLQDQESGTGAAACSAIEITPIQRAAGPILSLLSLEGSIYLSWTSIPTGFIYLVYRSDSESGVYSQIGQTSELFFEDAPGDGNTYFYKVTAIEPSFGETHPSNIVSGAAGSTAGVRITDTGEFRITDSGEFRVI